MLHEMIGWSPPSTVAQGLRSDTEGNPFFLQEVIHQLDESGVAADRERMVRGHLLADGLGVPVRVRDFVARRMQRLSPEALEVLGVADARQLEQLGRVEGAAAQGLYVADPDLFDLVDPGRTAAGVDVELQTPACFERRGLDPAALRPGGITGKPVSPDLLQAVSGLHESESRGVGESESR